MTLYCDLDRAKRASRNIHISDLGFDSNADYNRFLREKIESASRQIDGYCNRPSDYFNGGAIITEYHDGKPVEHSDFYKGYLNWRSSRSSDRRRIFWMEQYPVISVTSVHENEASIGETDNWSEISSYRYLDNGKLIIAKSATPLEGHKNVKVIYKAGYSSTPKDVADACAQLVANGLHKLMSTYHSGEIRYTERMRWPDWEDPEIFSPDIRYLLTKYVKRRI